MLAGNQELHCHWDSAVINSESLFVFESSILPIKKSNLQKVRLKAIMLSRINDTFIFLIIIRNLYYKLSTLTDLNIFKILIKAFY